MKNQLYCKQAPFEYEPGSELLDELTEEIVDETALSSEMLDTLQLEEEDAFLDTAAVYEQEYEIIGTDSRKRVVNTKVEPYRHICKLEMTFVNAATGGVSTYRGTGTLIGSNKVLTAAHCIFDRNTSQYAQSVRVIPGKNGAKEPLGSAVSRRLNVPEGWRTAPNGRAAMPFDYGVITLKQPIGKRIGFWRRLAYKPDALLQRHRVNTAGYPGDKGANHQYVAYDRIVTVQPQTLEFLHDTWFGQSGSPIWVRWKEFRVIVGIVTTWDDAATPVMANTGIRLSATALAEIKNWIKK